MQHFGDGRFGEVVDERLSHAHVFLRSDFQIHRRALDDGDGMTESFDKLGFVGRLKIAALGVRIEQQLTAEDLRSLCGPQAVTRNGFHDAAVGRD